MRSKDKVPKNTILYRGETYRITIAECSSDRSKLRRFSLIRTSLASRSRLPGINVEREKMGLLRSELE